MAYTPPVGSAVQLVFRTYSEPPAPDTVLLVFGDDGPVLNFPPRYFLMDAMFF